MLDKCDAVLQVQVWTGWLLAAVGLLGALFTLLPFQQPEYVYEALGSSTYNCLHRAVWSFSIAWIIFACVKGYGGKKGNELTCKCFVINIQKLLPIILTKQQKFLFSVPDII
jgi:hypothetical protein